MKTKRLSDKALKECADLPWMQRSWGNPCDAARDALAYRRALRKAANALKRAWDVGEHPTKSDTVPLSEAMGIIDRALGAKR